MAGVGYYTGAITLPNLIDKIADELNTVASTHWSNGDAAWSAGKRCCKYVNGGETMYVALETVNTQAALPTYYGKGLRITFSDAWSSGPSGNKQQSFIAFEAKTATGIAGDLTTMLITYYLWIEDAGFCVMGVPESNTTDNLQGSFIAVAERYDPNTKEYSDGSGNFYGYFRCNYIEQNADRTSPTYDGLRLENVMRPFRYIAHAYKEYSNTPTTTYYGNTTNGQYTEIHKSWDAAYFGHSQDPVGIEFPKLAIKSSGNGKVYYCKPVVHNSITLYGFRHETSFDPIALSDLFMAWRPDSGLVDGDIIALPSPSTKKYLLKSLNSVDKATPLYYGIKYNA
ncbi:MAG: hypothetical protein OIN88_03685 [Candidatus Methanoperedens sp.]|nr:hypothetical protein [Candidatus Methanoperedens sp.]